MKIFNECYIVFCRCVMNNSSWCLDDKCLVVRGRDYIYDEKKSKENFFHFWFRNVISYVCEERIVMKNILKFEEDDDYIEIRRESKILNSHFLLIFREIRYVFGVRWLLFDLNKYFGFHMNSSKKVICPLKY